MEHYFVAVQSQRLPATNEKVRVSRVELKRLGLAEFVRCDELLSGCELFQGLPPALLEALLVLGTVRRFTPHATVYGQGDSSRSIFWVVRGEAALQVAAGIQVAEVGRVPRGEVFGECAALGANGALRESSARAREELDAAEFPAEAFLALAEKAPRLLSHLHAVRSRRRAAHDEMLAFLNRW